MEQRFYFDTSVFGGIYDVEFEEETTLLFEKVTLGQIKCVYSNLTESELTNAPENVRCFFQDLPGRCKEKVLVTPDALKLAQSYVREKVVGETYNSVNLRLGHMKLEIHSPKEIVNYEDEE